MDETQIDSIAVNLLTPLVARLVGWASGILLGGAGISLTVPGDAPGKIALVVVALGGIIYHQIAANTSNLKIGQAGFVQGAAYAGVNIPSNEIPQSLVNASSAVTPLPTNPTMPPPTPAPSFAVDAQKNVTVLPSQPINPTPPSK
jgi:hypothetical protein